MSVEYASMLEAIRDNCVARVELLNDFHGVSVLSRKKGDLLTAILARLAETGVGIVVSVPNARMLSTQSEQCILSPVNIIFEVSENVIRNQGPGGTGKGAMFLAERVAANFQYWCPLPADPLNGGAAMEPGDPGIVELGAPQQLPVKAGFDPKQLYILAVHFQLSQIAVPLGTP